MTPEQLEAIEGIGPKTVEKISLAVNNYFASLESGEAGEALATPSEAEATPVEAGAEEAAASPEAEAAAPAEITESTTEEPGPVEASNVEVNDAENAGEAEPAESAEEPAASEDEAVSAILSRWRKRPRRTQS